ncbi:MAG: helix-turn-helix domain-containing protein [Selenomonadaceae bacterium]|nr:helix-turn-helix domain-containing protein [Selenomonadaceae bacterium]MBR3723191.1 helix-turn-helix domain-containing protein [Selenomonadaceae bacterium]
MPKDTRELQNELKKAEGLENFLVDNQKDFRRYTLAEYLERLLKEKNLSKGEVIEKSQLERLYAYHIFAGRKKNPSREKVIAIALAMALTPEETQYLLYYAGAPQLYVRNPLDSVLWYALENRMSVVDTNIMLENMAELPLISNEENLHNNMKKH